jgi:hypothetical protein
MIGDEPWSERTDGDPGEKVAHYGGDLEPVGEVAEPEGRRQANGKGEKYGYVMHGV